jgi:hypothetical protein
LLRVVAAWSIWRIPRFAVILILFFDVAAFSVPIGAWSSFSKSQVIIATCLVSLSIAYSGLSCSWERARRALWESTTRTGLLYRNLLSSWRFVAAVTLPMPLAAAVVIGGAAADWPALNISEKAQPYRYVYSTAGAVFATWAAHSCAELQLPYDLSLILAVPAYMIVGVLPVVLAQLAVGQRAGFGSFARWNAHQIEAYTLLIAMAEIVLLRVDLQILLWLSLPATLVLQRCIVRSDLRSADRATTRPMGERAWLLVAQEVLRACAVGAIMRIESADPAMVSYLARVKAGCDAIGMAGKSGLAVLMPHCPGENADAIATRMRAILHREGIVADVAVAAKPRDGHSLEDLLAVSEAELIARVAATRSTRLDVPEP